MSDRPTRVIKLGGSLLDDNGLAPRLRRWLAAQTAVRNVMVVGGGSLADVIREAFRRHSLSEEAAHWLCIRLLGVNAELLWRLLPETALVKHFDHLALGAYGGELVIFETESFLRNVEPRLSAPVLPHTWDVTSDSIAARLATALGAEELVLLKSGLPADGWSLEEAAEAGYVDPHFPTAAASLRRVRAVNLRQESLPERLLRGQCPS